MISKNNIIKIICYISRNTNIITSFAIFRKRHLTFLYGKSFYFLITRSGFHKRISHILCNRPIMVNVNKIAKSNTFLSRFTLFVNTANFYSGDITQFYFCQFHNKFFPRSFDSVALRSG